MFVVIDLDLKAVSIENFRPPTVEDLEYFTAAHEGMVKSFQNLVLDQIIEKRKEEADKRVFRTETIKKRIK